MRSATGAESVVPAAGRRAAGLGPAWQDTGYVFTREDGTPYHPAQVSERFSRLAYVAGLPPIRLHDLRHGAATLAAGKTMKEVSAMLRHSSESITSEITLRCFRSWLVAFSLVKLVRSSRLGLTCADGARGEG
jgi:integrase